MPFVSIHFGKKIIVGFHGILQVHLQHAYVYDKARFSIESHSNV